MVENLASRLAQDPRNRIVKVVWGGASLLAVSYLFRTNNPMDSMRFPFEKFVLNSSNFDVLTLEGALIDTVVSVPLVNPPSADMLSDYYMFAVAPAYNFNSTTTDERNMTVTDYFRSKTLFFNLSKIKAAMAPDATDVTISAVSPTTSGEFHGAPQPKTFVDMQFAATPEIAKSITVAGLETLPEYAGLIDAVVNQADSRLSLKIPQLWITSGRYTMDPQVKKYINWTATGYTYDSKRDKEAPFKLDTVAFHDAASGFTPPLAEPANKSETLRFLSPSSSTPKFSFKVNFESLQVTSG